MSEGIHPPKIWVAHPLIGNRRIYFFTVALTKEEAKKTIEGGAIAYPDVEGSLFRFRVVEHPTPHSLHWAVSDLIGKGYRFCAPYHRIKSTSLIRLVDELIRA